MMRTALALCVVAACGPAVGPSPSPSQLPSNKAPPSPGPTRALPDEFEHFAVALAQHGKLLGADNHRVELSRDPFIVMVLFREPDGVLINVSDKDTAYRAAAAGVDLDRLPGFGETGMAEWLFNKERDILVADDAPSYWYFTSDEDHRFDAPCERDDSVVLCQRTVEKLSYLGGASIPVEQAPDRLFLVFAKTRWDRGQHVEMARDHVALDFL